jgi:hypothetical protein
MSGDSYTKYSSDVSLKKSFRSTESAEEREERKKELGVMRSSFSRVKRSEVDHTKFNKEVDNVDISLAKTKITRPKAKKNYLIAVDASGSNQEIANHILQCGGFLLAPFTLMDLSVSFGFIFFSDHMDDRPEQEIDFVVPSVQGEGEIVAGMYLTHTQNGHDIPEMIECVMERAATKLPLEGTDTVFVLITDSVAHGMGFKGDHGCPSNVDWKKARAKVMSRFSDFVVIGCAGSKYPTIPALQAKFLEGTKKAGLNFIDLSSMEDEGERKRLVVNAIQFVAARDNGAEFAEAYLRGLYTKLIGEGLFGQETDAVARDRIQRFVKYLHLGEEKKREMLTRIFGD